MKKLLMYSAVAMIGAIGYGVCLLCDVNNGDVVYENDDMYVISSSNKSYGWSYAEVHWKKPIEKED